MFDNLINALLIAWILSEFEFDKVCITGFRELFNVNITINTYYFIFAIIGLGCGIIEYMFKIQK